MLVGRVYTTLYPERDGRKISEIRNKPLRFEDRRRSALGALDSLANVLQSCKSPPDMVVTREGIKVRVAPDWADSAVTILYGWDEFPDDGSTRALVRKFRDATEVLRNRMAKAVVSNA